MTAAAAVETRICKKICKEAAYVLCAHTTMHRMVVSPAEGGVAKTQARQREVVEPRGETSPLPP